MLDQRGVGIGIVEADGPYVSRGNGPHASKVAHGGSRNGWGWDDRPRRAVPVLGQRGPLRGPGGANGPDVVGAHYRHREQDVPRPRVLWGDDRPGQAIPVLGERVRR